MISGYQVLINGGRTDTDTDLTGWAKVEDVYGVAIIR